MGGQQRVEIVKALVKDAQVLILDEPTAPPTISESDLATMMAGRAVNLKVDQAPAQPKGTVLEIRGLTVRSETWQPVVDGIDLDVRAGEVVCIPGVQGNGQSELTRAQVGLQHRVSGSVALNGEELLGRSPRKVLDSGVGFVPEDRSADAEPNANHRDADPQPGHAHGPRPGHVVRGCRAGRAIERSGGRRRCLRQVVRGAT